MERNKFKIDSIRYVSDKKYRNEFIKRFEGNRSRYLLRKSIILSFFEKNFDVDMVCNEFFIGLLGVSNYYIRKNKIAFIFNIAERIKEPDKTIKIICEYVNQKNNLFLNNENEVRENFYNLMIMNEYWIGFYDTMLNRTEKFRNIILDDREKLKGIPESSIFQIKKIFFDYSYNIVKNFPEYYPYLFPFENYIKDLILMDKREKNPKDICFVIQTDFYKYIEKITNIDEKTIGQRYRDFKKKKLIPNFNKKFLPVN